jgi:hypothetical protein
MECIPAKLIRLRQGSRYVVAIQAQNGQISANPYWNEMQALASIDAPSWTWPSIPIEVYAEHHSEGVPDDATVFVRSTRRGIINGVILWSRNGIHHSVLETQEQAIAIARDLATIHGRLEECT